MSKRSQTIDRMPKFSLSFFSYVCIKMFCALEIRLIAYAQLRLQNNLHKNRQKFKWDQAEVAWFISLGDNRIDIVKKKSRTKNYLLKSSNFEKMFQNSH